MDVAVSRLSACLRQYLTHALDGDAVLHGDGSLSGALVEQLQDTLAAFAKNSKILLVVGLEESGHDGAGYTPCTAVSIDIY